MLLALENLTALYLSLNRLTTFPNLTPMRSTLRALYLDSNRISDINKDALWNLTNLEILDLSHNVNLTHFPYTDSANLQQLHLAGTAVSSLTPMLGESIVRLDLRVQNSVDVCKCANAWLKQVAPKMANFEYDDKACDGDGQLWSSMTVEEMNRKCDREHSLIPTHFTHTTAMKMQLALQPSMLHTYEAETTKLQCTMHCLDTPSCVSFYWRKLQDRRGDCVLIAPGDSISVESVPGGGLQQWSYYIVA